jgi:hypothetical protein
MRTGLWSIPTSNSVSAGMRRAVAAGDRRWVQAECVIDDGGGVWERGYGRLYRAD